jgi:ABC-type nickel/cobalt efflux system permease component RcnA
MLYLWMIVCLLAFDRTSEAHPMGNFSINRFAKIDLQSDRVVIHYLMDMAEIPAYQEMQQGEIKAVPGDPAVLRYIAARGNELGRELRLLLNGQALPLRMVSSGVIFPPGAGGLPTLKMGFVYEATYPTAIDRTRVQLRYADSNFPGHAGWKEIIAVSSAGSLQSSSVPAEDRSGELSNYPTDLLNSPPQVLEASVTAALPSLSSAIKFAVKTTSSSSVAVQGPIDSRAEAMISSASAPSSRMASRAPVAPPVLSPSALHHGSGESAQPPHRPAATSLQANRQRTPRNRFTELIAAPQVSLWFLLTAAFIAVGLGGLHALEPGHGKTIVAAYLVGSRGTAGHAILLGLIVTVSHTAGVFALGAITLYASQYIVPEKLYPWLGMFSGITIAALGCYMALRRLSGAASDHSHLPGETYSHGFLFNRAKEKQVSKDAGLTEYSSKSIALAQLLGLGIIGGVIPCPAALIVLLSAFALHRVSLGFFLIVAFSLGLAAVLIGFGMVMVYARRFLSSTAMDGPIIKRWLPIASSIFIFVMGLVLVMQAVLSMNLRWIAVSQSQLGSLLLIAGLGLILGMRHSTDADHVVAISTIVTRQKSIRGAAVIGSVWGIGHTITIFIVGSLIILFKVEIPPRVGLSMEFCVALMLVLLGVLNLSGAMPRITSMFTPAPYSTADTLSVLQSGDPRPRRWWLGASLAQLGAFQCFRPLVIGLVHGLAGSAAVALLVLSTIHDPLWATLYLLIFGAGTMMGMMGMTTAMAVPLAFAGKRSATFTRYLSTASGMASLCFGSFLVFQLGIVGDLFTSHPLWTPR